MQTSRKIAARAARVFGLAVGLLGLSACGKGLHLFPNSPFDGNAPLTLASISPASGSRGTKLTITGSGFTSSTAVTVGGNLCSPVALVSSTQLTCPAPSHLSGATVNISVQNGSSSAVSLNSAFTYRSYLYVANTVSNNISIFTLDPTTGAPSPAGTSVGQNSVPDSLLLDPSGKNLYAVNRDTNDISQFTINGASGALNYQTSYLVGSAPSCATISPTSGLIYAAERQAGQINILHIDPVTGGLASVGSALTGWGPQALAFTPDGRFLYSANQNASTVSMFSVSITGQLTPIAADVPVGSNPDWLAVNPAGTLLYVANANSNFVVLLKINQTTGALSALPDTATSLTNGLSAILFNPNGKTIYAVENATGSHGYLFPVDATGNMTAPTPLATGSGPAALALDPNGAHLYLTNSLDNTVMSFSLSGSNPTLTGTAATGTTPGALIVD